MPATLKVAVVTVTFGLPNVTAPGPLTLFQMLLNVLPAGNPSSLTLPLRLATFGSVIC